jgi:hypothetical protein
VRPRNSEQTRGLALTERGRTALVVHDPRGADRPGEASIADRGARRHRPCTWIAQMPKKLSKTLALRGKVIAHNISPKGHVEGALIETPKGIAQLNFPKHGADDLVRRVKVGASVDLPAELEDEDGDHPVYRASDPGGVVTGAVVRLNYALHGEVNGYHLDDGTFVHVKPDGAKRYKLRVGDRITAEGPRRAGVAANVLEPEQLTKLAPRARR